MKNLNRDETIDHLRAVAMIWVIVVHCLYWGGFFENERINLIKSFFLFEMPLFFFVTGASNSFSRIDGYFSFVFKRYKRILIPYWVYALICAALSIINYGMNGERYNMGDILLSWMIPVNRQITNIPYLTWALWFIPVYLCIVLLIPLLKQIGKSSFALPFVLVHALILFCVCYAKLGWIQNIVFYSWWTYIGLLYKNIIYITENRFWRGIMRKIVYIGIIVLIVMFHLGNSMDMQYNKFPPNNIFWLYSVIMMSIIILLIPYINKVYAGTEKFRVTRTILALFSTRSLTVFLYQSFAFYITIRLTNAIISGNGIMDGIAKNILCFITTILLCSVLAIVFGKIENIR